MKPQKVLKDQDRAYNYREFQHEQNAKDSCKTMNLTADKLCSSKSVLMLRIQVTWGGLGNAVMARS